MSRAKSSRLIAIPLLLAVTSCNQAILNAPLDATIVVTANPPFIPANGGVSIISALVTKNIGTPVPDGTVVQFFTTLGRIEEQGKTNDGVARVKLVSDARSGKAVVTALSGAASAELEDGVTIGNENIDTITMRANPPRITSSNSTHVFAAVFDQFGNPVSNVPVFFRVTIDPATEFFDITGPVPTNNNGEAENVLRTRRQTAGEATVTVLVPLSGKGPLAPLVVPIQ